MRVVDHVLIEHGVWVAKDECWLGFVSGFGIVIINQLVVNREEHSVNDSLAGCLVRDPPMLALKCRRKNIAHLLWLPNQLPEAAKAIGPSAAACNRSDGLLCHLHELLTKIFQVLDSMKVFR